MVEFLCPLAYLRVARLSALATGPAPAWLWQADGKRLLWANGVAAALEGAASATALVMHHRDCPSAAGAQIAGIAEILPASGSPRLATLQLGVASSERRLPTLCSRLLPEDDTPAVLAVAIQPTGRWMPLRERIERLIGDAPAAVFSPDGQLIYATTAIQDRLGAKTSLISLDAASLGSEALANGHAEGDTPTGHLRLDRVGRDVDTALVATFTSAPADVAAGAPQQRQPLRFVWEMDRDGRFTIKSDAFVNQIGPENAAVLGRPWVDVAAALGLDPTDQIARAIESRETWSGITLQWPVAASDELLPVEMSGLPTFDRERNFRGYRGFGVCRGTEVVAASPHEAETSPSPAPALSPGERTAFRELARQLSARLKGEQPNGVGVAEETPPPPASDTSEIADRSASTSIPTFDSGARALLDRLPAGVLIYRAETPLYANRAFLRWSGDASVDAFATSGALDKLLGEFVANGEEPAFSRAESASSQRRLLAVEWHGEPAHALVVIPASPQQNELAAALEHAQAELRDLRATLASEMHAVAEAKRQSDKASQAKSAFMAKVSHEMRTPLTAIIGFAEVMMDEQLGPIDNERYRAYLKDIHSAGTQALTLLNELADLSKIAAGKVDIELGEVDLNALTRECVERMQPQANRGRVIIRTSLAPGLPSIVADTRSVRQIVLNLLSNSIKFTDAGGQVIVSTTSSDQGEAILRVRDTGIGMSEQDVESAVEPFRQIETSARAGSGSIGLGLPLTKALAEANRANFAIKSAVNAGTLVEVAFPTATARNG